MEQLKIATWNVNSIKVRLEHVLNFLEQYEIDALLLQETKSEDKISRRPPLPRPGSIPFITAKKPITALRL